MEGKKCSFDEHKEINSIKYCPECRIYMCNKCEINHSSLFKNHHQYNINKDEDIFTGFCKEKNHHNKLKYYCKNHNQLCCVECIAKLNKEGEGQHKDCEVFYLENIKEEKKNKLKENIRCLEDLQNKFNELMKSLNTIFEEIEKNKENLKLEIQNVFTKIRNAINDREEQLLLDVDKLYDDKYFNEDIIKKSGKLPKQIELSLEKGKLLIDKEWDNNNLNSYINDSINYFRKRRPEGCFEYKDYDNIKVNIDSSICLELTKPEDDLQCILNGENGFKRELVQCLDYSLYIYNKSICEKLNASRKDYKCFSDGEKCI